MVRLREFTKNVIVLVSPISRLLISIEYPVMIPFCSGNGIVLQDRNMDREVALSWSISGERDGTNKKNDEEEEKEKKMIKRNKKKSRMDGRMRKTKRMRRRRRRRG